MKTPTIKWAQNDEKIFIDIQVLPNDFEIKINEQNIEFKQDDYECNLRLFQKIDTSKSKYNTNRIFEFVLKKDEDEEWKQLLENKNQYNVSVNWDKCDISDDEEENEMPDMSSLMGGGGMPDMSSLMGGEGGMPDMSSLMGGGMPDMSSLMGGEGGMPDMSSESLCPVCPDQDCEDCYEDDFEVDSNEENEVKEPEADSNEENEVKEPEVKTTSDEKLIIDDWEEPIQPETEDKAKKD